MNRETLEFSFRRAWRDISMRLAALLCIALMGGSTIFFLWHALSIRSKTEGIVLHYSIHGGIDEVREWPWAFILPIFWISITLMDLVFAYGMYYKDVQWSRSVAWLGCLWSFPWAMTFLYLFLMNSV